MYKLTICAIAKNEHFGLEEWVAFHRVVGVEHFYIYDNDSMIPVRETLAKQIAAGYVTVIDFPGLSKQMGSYNHCLANFGKDSDWIAFIDCDEFLLPKKTDYVPDVLDKFTNYGALQVNWICFGTSGNIERPSGLVIENYTKASPPESGENLHTKAIVQPKHTRCTGGNPHCFLYNKGYIAVDEQYRVVPSAWSQTHTAELIQLNHYVSKSVEDFQMKISKGRADAAHLPVKNLQYLNDLDASCIINNTYILRFVDRVKALFQTT
jgi:hypothetical protein